MASETSRRTGIALFTLATLVVLGIGVERSIDRGNDFDNFYDSAVSVWQDGTLLREKGTLRYPLTFQLFVAPLGALPIEAAAPLWILLNFAACAALPFGLARLSGTPPARQGWAWFAAAPFLIGNFTLGQSGALLLALSTFGVLVAARGRAIVGGAALTSAGLLKVFPLGFLAIPIVLGRARGTLAGAALAFAVAIGVAGFAIGFQESAEDVATWVEGLRDTNNAHQMVENARSLRPTNQGLSIVMIRSLTRGFNPHPDRASKGSIQVVDLPIRWVWGLYYGLVAALGAALIVSALHARRTPTPRVFLGLYAMAIPAALAVSPIVWTHYFAWWIPALVYLADRTRFLVVFGTVGLLGVFPEAARALGLHAMMSLLLFVLVMRRLWREVETSRSLEASAAAQ